MHEYIMDLMDLVDLGGGGLSDMYICVIIFFCSNHFDTFDVLYMLKWTNNAYLDAGNS